jgi:hypothetical protein
MHCHCSVADSQMKVGTLINTYNHDLDVFHRKWPSSATIEAMHEAFFGLLNGYHQNEKTSTSQGVHGSYWRYVAELFGEKIERSVTMQAQAQGPPDWVSGPKGITYTCEDVKITVCTRLRIPEGCLNGGM